MMDKTQKAMLMIYWNEGPADAIDFQYNPTEWSFDKSVQIAEVNIPGLDSPLLQFVRGNNETLNLEIFFDSTEDGLGAEATSVTEKTDKFYQLVKIEPTRHAPPLCSLNWNIAFPGVDTSDSIGTQWRSSFECIVQSVKHRYTLFSSTGVPLRAILNVTFKEWKPLDVQLSELNLSSPDRTHGHVLKAGESLPSLAARYYGRCKSWRSIADAAGNGIEDPRRLTIGQVLSIPPIR